MKIVIENVSFPYDMGCRILKLKHEHSPFEQLNDVWNDIVPLSFQEIAQIENLEQRRVGIVCLGLERISKEVKPKLINRETIKKVSNFIDRDGNLVNEEFSDTYELYEVKGKEFGITKNSWQKMDDSYFVKFKDTSTDREYMIWVDLESVAKANFKESFYFSEEIKQKINAIQCIAWTMQTNVPIGQIQEIVRQGDCILVKPKSDDVKLLNSPRHLTEKEYRTLLVAES